MIDRRTGRPYRQCAIHTTTIHRHRLVCLHWAGGNSSIYRAWDLGPAVEVVAIELPGRQA